MTVRHLTRRAAGAAGLALWVLGAAAPQAQAHPLGNFSINHYTGFTLHPDRVEVLSVTDTAEIPTLQAAPSVDANGDGTADESERATWAAARCAETAGKLAVSTPDRLNWTITSATFAYQPGQAGLRTSRLECRLRAPLDLAAGPVTLRVETGADAGRVGWNEITATGAGARLEHSTVPETSPTDELRSYPRDLLDTPRGDTRAEFTALAGDGASVGGAPSGGTPLGGGLTGKLESLSRRLTSLAGAERLTLPVGLLAVLLSVVLGAGHALLPGHGKTVMAAYLAGRRGRTRDAITVGATVTITHTAGVLVIGLCLTTFSSLAGDTVLGWLGVVSGALVAVVGAGLLTDAVRRSRHHHRADAVDGVSAVAEKVPALVGAGGGGVGHGEHHEEAHEHGDGDLGHGSHDHEHPHPHPHPHDHDHDHDHDDHHGDHDHHHDRPHRHGFFGHRHSHAQPAGAAQPFSTRGLVGLGIAGGLVPSPSALVVLLGAIALGRTIFGTALVVAYGLGMAATLTAVGLLLVRIGDRLGRLADRPLVRLVRRVAPHTAVLTAVLVLVVGVGLMIRSLPPVL